MTATFHKRALKAMTPELEAHVVTAVLLGHRVDVFRQSGNGQPIMRCATCYARWVLDAEAAKFIERCER